MLYVINKFYCDKLGLESHCWTHCITFDISFDGMVQVRKIDVIHSTFAAFAGGIWSWGPRRPRVALVTHGTRKNGACEVDCKPLRRVRIFAYAPNLEVTVIFKES